MNLMLVASCPAEVGLANIGLEGRASQGAPAALGAPVGATPKAPQGLGVDPVFQIYSYLWNINQWGEESEYYNITQVLQNRQN